MNRNYGYLLFFSAGLFLAGCAGHSGSNDGSAANPSGPGPAGSPPSHRSSSSGLRSRQ